MGRNFSFGLDASSVWSSASRSRCKRWWTSALPPIARCTRFSAASSSYCADRRVRLRRRRQGGCAAVRCPAEQEEARRRFSTYSAASTSLRQAQCRSSAGSVLAEPRPAARGSTRAGMRCRARSVATAPRAASYCEGNVGVALLRSEVNTQSKDNFLADLRLKKIGFVFQVRSGWMPTGSISSCCKPSYCTACEGSAWPVPLL